MSSEERGSGFAAGLLLGGLIGAAVAFFLNPREGEESMGSLADRGIELKVRAEEVAIRAREEADTLITKGKIVLEGQKHRVQDALDEGKEAAAIKKEELMAKYRLAKERGEVPLEDPTGRVRPQLDLDQKSKRQQGGPSIGALSPFPRLVTRRRGPPSRH